MIGPKVFIIHRFINACIMYASLVVLYAPQDDMMVRVFNYNTLEKMEMFEAHSDYIRSIIVHPTQPYILTSSGKSPEA